MSRTHPARFFRASALGVVAAGLLVPATASAQISVPPDAPVYQPSFTKLQSATTEQGPVVALLHGRFDADKRDTVMAVTDSGPYMPTAGVALFGRTPNGYGRRIGETLQGEMPVASTVGRLDDTDRESGIVVSRKGAAGVLESVDWHGETGVVHRVAELDQVPAGVAVGQFLPNHGLVVAVSLANGHVRFFEATNTGFERVADVNGVPAGPLATSGYAPSGGSETLITRAASDGRSGVRTVFTANDGTDGSVYTGANIGGTSRPFGASQNRIAQDRDVFGQTWFAAPENGLTTVSWIKGGWDTGEMPAGGPYLGSNASIDAPVVMDLFGHGQRDAVAALDGTSIRAISVVSPAGVEGPLNSGGTIATALDVDDDRRDELVVADQNTVTLYANRTGGKETQPSVASEALVPSVFDAVAGEQVVTSRSFDLVVPTNTDDAYECAIGDGDWIPCATGQRTALTVQADGSYTVRVRRMVTGTSFWSDEQSIAFRVDASEPAKPVLLEQPAADTSWPQFRVPTAAGLRYEYRVDGQGDWIRLQESWFRPEGLQDGPHRVSVRAVDTVRDVPSQAVDVDFVLDTVDPAAPLALGGPDGVTAKRTATIAFDGEPDGTFECLIDAVEYGRAAGGVQARSQSRWRPCGSPLTMGDLSLGDHTVSVRQVDKAGNRGRATTWNWTVVEPDPEPVVETPAPTPDKQTVTPPATKAPETTPAPAATPPAPAPEAARPAAPKPVAAKLAVGASAGKGQTPTATSTGRRVAVGCAAPGAEGYRCAVTVTRNGKTVGEGRRTGAGVVPVNLDKATARKVQRLGGLKVRVTLTVKTADGQTSKTRKTVRILPKKVLVVPTDGLFAFDSATPSKGADALAKQIAGQLDGARTITIVGHTDAKGTADVNRRLGQQRAEAFRRLLAQHGFDGKVAVDSAGDTQPRASNATDGGRALNRRVEIEVRY